MTKVRILCSIYYRHSQLSALARDGILPVFNLLRVRKNIDAFNYFLSTHKGENIVLLLYLKSKNQEQVKNLIEKKIKEFIFANKIDYIEETLPLNQIFLNISPNTLHFWDHDPFLEWNLFDNNEADEKRIGTTLSHLCLREVSGIDNNESEGIFSIYLRLLQIFEGVIERSGLGIQPNFIEKILYTIREMKHDSLSDINQIQGKAQQLYNQYIDDDSDRFKSLKNKIFPGESEKLKERITEEWTNIIHEAFKIKKKELPIMSNEFAVQLFIIISQKISLRIDRLITALIILKESRIRDRN